MNLSEEIEKINKYCESNNLYSLFTLSSVSKNLMVIAAFYSLGLYKEGIFNNRANQILNIFLPEEELNNSCDIKGMTNTGASCYLDSVLLCLFASESEFVNKFILNSEIKYDPIIFCGDIEEENINIRKEIQKELNNIFNFTHGKNDYKVCTDLRKLFKKCKTEQENFGKTGERDDGEFLIYLLSLFPTSKAVIEFSIYGSYDEKEWIERNVYKDYNSSVVCSVPGSYLKTLSNREYIDIGTFLKRVDIQKPDEPFGECLFNYNKTVSTYISSPYLIFYIQRKYGDYKKKKKYLSHFILPTKYVVMKSGERFFLSGIVVWENNHFTSYFKCKDGWYYYNDLGPRFKHIGDYKHLLKSSPSVFTNGTLYFYSPSKTRLQITGDFKHISS